MPRLFMVELERHLELGMKKRSVGLGMAGCGDLDDDKGDRCRY